MCDDYTTTFKHMYPFREIHRVDRTAWERITSLGLNRRKKTHRGKRGGRNRQLCNERDTGISTASPSIQPRNMNVSTGSISFAMVNARSLKKQGF